MASKGVVYVGLSGGVDSAVSAALLKREGYEVVGLFAWIALSGYPCSAGEDRREALRVAAHLRIPFEEVDLSKAYEERIFKEALRAYKEGETPNPDALCNREIKFGLLYDFARERGADYFATGHYARLSPRTTLGKTGNDSSVELMAGADQDKDQSYFLWAVPEEKLAHTLFPVGALRKSQVRALAEKFELPNAKRKDSQGLCFLGAVSMEDALVRELRPEPGEVLDESGARIGTHRGAVLYTIGQRHGFELNARGNSEKPYYVVGKDVEKNVLVVSTDPRSAHPTRELSLRDINFIGEASSGPCQARFRYRQKLIDATLNTVYGRVTLAEPHAVPVGQSLVLYAGERCLGGGIIASAQ